MNRILSSSLIAILAVACAGDPTDPVAPDEVELVNAADKSDSTGAIVRLTDEAPAARLFVRCDDAFGCSGTVRATLESPDVCSMFPDEPLCGIGGHDGTLEQTLATLEVRSAFGSVLSSTVLDALAFDDGFLIDSISLGFDTETSGTRRDFLLVKDPSAPQMVTVQAIG